MEKRLKEAIRKSIFNLLKEDSQDTDESPAGSSQPAGAKSTKGVISTKGAFGSGGRSKKFVAEAGARATDDPKGLLKDLGITKSVAGNDLSQALKVINLAIHTNPLMSQAYSGAKEISETIKGKNSPQKIISIKMGSLDRKNGVRFLAHTLTAAVNANILNLSGGLQFGQTDSKDIAVYMM